MPHNSRQLEGVGTNFMGSRTAAGVAPIRSRTDAGAVVARFMQRGWYERGDLVHGLWPAVLVGVAGDG
jgi:hypothetical protein